MSWPLCGPRPSPSRFELLSCFPEGSLVAQGKAALEPRVQPLPEGCVRSWWKPPPGLSGAWGAGPFLKVLPLFLE